MPKITPVEGEPCCYYVESSSTSKEAYKVDLLANFGNGECNCKDFEIRRRPNAQPAIDWLKMHSKDLSIEKLNMLKDSMPETCKRLYTHQTMCKHIFMARKKWTDDMLQIISIQQKEHLQEGS